MHTVVSLSQPTRVPRKSSSYATLRRDKQQPSTDPPSSYYSPRSTYIDSFMAGQPSSSSNSNRVATPKFTSTSFDFHSFPSTEEFDGPSAIPSPFPRERSRTGPSKNTNWIDRPIGPRISVTSTLNEGTPPDTPVDNASFKDLDVLVAAPVSGVEMMDALVDGMNGGDEIGLSSRSRFGIPNHHPLYQPPLPTPPPGVVLGGGKSRRQKKPPKLVYRSSFSDQDDDQDDGPLTATPKRRRPLPPGRSASNTTITPVSSSSHSPPPSTPPTPINTESSFHSTRPRTAPSSPSSADKRKSLAPSISDIIRAYAPQEAQVRARAPLLNRTSSYSRSVGHSIVHEEPEPEPEPITAEEEADILSRSSIDSIADEVRRTLRHQVSMKHVAPPPPHRHSFISDSASIISPRSDGCGTASIYSSSIASSQPPLSPFDTGRMSNLTKPPTPSQEVAQYLRSTRLTTLLKLTRSPHASHDNPLTVSLSDLGSQNGFPVLVFLGLGCVRHIMGLYDEMAQCLGLRLITIDRWGLGRTEPRAKSAKGIIQWASVVEEVLDRLHIDECSVMAHSAGAPYALSFANKLPYRIRGEICLLAPWVGESAGYKWLKYVPNGILKTAQAAEWKLQTWMIGKPPTLAWEGIGYTAQQTKKQLTTSSPGSSSVYPESYSRPSLASSSFSAYDDLRDFDGRFESMSTLGTAHPNSNSRGEDKMQVTRKSSRGILGRLKSTTPQSPNDRSPPSTGKRLKALRSMGSLKSKSSSSSSKKQQSLPSPQLPPSLKVDVGLGLDDTTWTKSFTSDSFSVHNDRSRTSTPEKYPRSEGRRSLSFSSPPRLISAQSLPPSPNPASSHDFSSSTSASELPSSPNNAYQATLGNALIAASHSESAKGTHNDLLQILNHDNHPWGFSYEAYPHKVQVWYGDRDEKIAENAVRWMERTMGEGMCSVRVVKGADHGLMYKSGVVVDVLEYLLGFWH
ncbi:hypothetical protein J3R30DRAFT_3401954 [Lentinula aciculospora]|uniref:Alpha/beta-hydrolase n=1 Tax=Lentinula aciculospora TaxID=153920 RepID=A0A9W9AMC8_9AGAR|nr:hypothetical protein J3R30DRAFT_3401954 [Lentinula aciculospora]